MTVSGSDGIAGQPVTLHNTARGTWERQDAAGDGSWSLQVEAGRGDQLQVLRNVDSLAYVLLDATGLAAVDLNHFYGESDDADGDGVPDQPQQVQSQVLRYLLETTLDNGSDPLCDPNGLYLGGPSVLLAQDFAILGRGSDGAAEGTGPGGQVRGTCPPWCAPTAW